MNKNTSPKSRRQCPIVTSNVNSHVSKPSDSPGLKSLRERNKVVKERIKGLEIKKVERKKVSLSPNKVKIKQLTAKFNARSDSNINNKIDGHKDDKNVKELVNDHKSDKKVKKDKNDDKEIRKLELIKESLRENANMKEKGEAETMNSDNVELEAVKIVEVKNAFEILMESKFGSSIPSSSLKKSKRIRKVDLKKDSQDIRKLLGSGSRKCNK